MSVEIYLEPVQYQTRFAPLGVIGYCFTQSDLLQPVWTGLNIAMKQYAHTPEAKLQDVLVAIMAGCRSLNQVNTRIRPDTALACAWQRRRFAEQSTLSRMLDALDAQQVDQLRAGNLQLLRQHSQLRQHDWTQRLLLDIDPTSLLTSKRVEGGRKGWVSGQKHRYCRHVIRFMVAGYHESLLSVLYPGDRHGYEHFKPAIQTLLQHWPWSRAQRQHIILRSDAELGTDANLRYALWLGFQILMKGYSGRRTQAWAHRTPDTTWEAVETASQRWTAPAPENLRLGRRADTFLLR